MAIFNSYVSLPEVFFGAFLDMFMGGRASSLLPGRGRHGFHWLGILQHSDSGRLGHWIGIFWRIYQMKIRGCLRSMNIWGLKDVPVFHIPQLGAVVSNRYEGDVKQIHKKGHLLTSVLDIWENSCTISFGMGLKWLKHETSQHFPAMFVSMLLRTWRCQCDNKVLWMLPSFSEYTCRLWGFHCGSRVSMMRGVPVSSVSHHVLRPWTCWMIHRWTVQSLEGRDADLLFGLVVAHLDNLLPACPFNSYLDPFFRLGITRLFFLPGTPFGVLFRLEWMEQPGISMAHPATSATESRSLEGFLDCIGFPMISRHHRMVDLFASVDSEVSHCIFPENANPPLGWLIFVPGMRSNIQLCVKAATSSLWRPGSATVLVPCVKRIQYPHDPKR